MKYFFPSENLCVFLGHVAMRNFIRHARVINKINY